MKSRWKSSKNKLQRAALKISESPLMLPLPIFGAREDMNSEGNFSIQPPYKKRMSGFWSAYLRFFLSKILSQNMTENPSGNLLLKRKIPGLWETILPRHTQNLSSNVRQNTV